MTAHTSLDQLSTEDLERRRGELAQGLLMAAAEGLPLDDDDARAVAALDAELARRSAAAERPKRP